jgi:hypothetical protein
MLTGHRSIDRRAEQFVFPFTFCADRPVTSQLFPAILSPILDFAWFKILVKVRSDAQ